MTYVVPTSADAKFDFKIGSKKYAVTKLEDCPPERMVLVLDAMETIADESVGGIARVRAMANLAGLFGDKGTPAGDAARKLNAEQLMGLVSAYAADSGLTLGESGASSES